MGLTDAMLSADISFIQADLASTSATETVSKIPAGETAIDDTFGVVRAKQLTKEELKDTGFETQYQFSVYAKVADIGTTTEGDVIVMANDDRLRVHRIVKQPANISVKLDLGDEFEDGDEF